MTDRTTLKALDLGAYAQFARPDDGAEPDLGPPAQLQWIDVSLLVIDTSYQRDAGSRKSKDRVAEIARGFDWRYFTPVIVSPVTRGRYAIVDGQHRTLGAMLRGVTSVPCAVILADRRGQARAFEVVNGHVTNVTTRQIFKAKVASGDAESDRVRQVAADAGVTIVYGRKEGSDAMPNETVALEAIRRAVRFHGEARTGLALSLLRERSAPKRRTLVAANVTALVEALAERPDIEAATDLAARSALVDYEDLRARSARLAVTDEDQGQSAHLRDLMIEALAGGGAVLGEAA